VTWRNTPDRWGSVSQFLHWLVVALIVAMAWLGLTMTDLPDTPRKVQLFALHKSIGLTILALVVLRLAWRGFAGAPAALPMPRWQRRIAIATHGALYALLLAMPLSGWIVNSSSGFPLHWFGVVRVPQFIGRNDALNALAKEWHEWLFWTLVVVATAHAAAAFWHHLFRQDATLARMLPRRWLRVHGLPPMEDGKDA
jgi:cytochrome b561